MWVLLLCHLQLLCTHVGYFIMSPLNWLLLQCKNGADIISNLRSGVAAQKAVVKMQERGFSNLRKSRHRLTPGTVKFAAFHVLSLEGSQGLNILEVAEKIQVLLLIFIIWKLVKDLGNLMIMLLLFPAPF